MNQMSKVELLQVTGGFSINGTLINAFARGIDVVLGVGRSLGTAIRRWQEGRLCPI